MRIGTNFNIAMNAQRHLALHTQKTANVMMRLSTGLRINSAADDAAGLAISEKMRAQVRGLRMAARNAADSISLIQTAEGALNEVHDILQRMRELAVQAANDTNTEKDRKSIQAEITQLIDEINRIGNTTEFNTKSLLDGSLKGVTEEKTGTMQVNNNSGLLIDFDKMSETQKSIAKDREWAFDGGYMLIKTNQTVDGSYKAEFNVGDYKLIGPDGKVYDFTVAYEEIEEEVISEETGELETVITLLYTGTVMTDAGTVTIKRDGILFSENTENNFTADIHALKTSESLTFVFTKYKAASSDLGNSLMLQIGANSGQTMFLSIGDMRPKALGIDGIDVTTRFGATTAIETINNAISAVSSQRSMLGAVQNRLEHTIRNLETTAENLQAAESRIRDADMIREMMEFTKYTILQQAAQAMLAQANMNQKSMLRLLEAI